MATKELFSSRQTAKRVRAATHERIYSLSPHTTSDSAMTALQAAAPSQVIVEGRLLTLSDLEVDPVDGRVYWLGRATYTPPELERNREIPAVGDREISVRIVGETQTLRHSYQQKRLIIGEEEPTLLNDGGPINDNGDGPEGVEVIRPACGFTERHIIAEENVDAAWVKTMAGIVGKLNDAEFRGFEAGELLLMGIEARSRPDLNYEAYFTWAVRPNIDEIDVAGVTLTSLIGWHYVWVRSRKKVVDDEVRHEAVEVVVDQVYEYADYDQLGIGDTTTTTTTTGA